MPSPPERKDSGTYLLLARILRAALLVLSLMTSLPLVLIAWAGDVTWAVSTPAAWILGGVGIAMALAGMVSVLIARRRAAVVPRLVLYVVGYAFAQGCVLWGFIGAVAGHSMWVYAACVLVAAPVWVLGWPTLPQPVPDARPV